MGAVSLDPHLRPSACSRRSAAAEAPARGLRACEWCRTGTRAVGALTSTMRTRPAVGSRGRQRRGLGLGTRARPRARTSAETRSRAPRELARVERSGFAEPSLEHSREHPSRASARQPVRRVGREMRDGGRARVSGCAAPRPLQGRRMRKVLPRPLRSRRAGSACGSTMPRASRAQAEPGRAELHGVGGMVVHHLVAGARAPAARPGRSCEMPIPVS